MDLTVQEKIDRVKEFRPIDDVFFEVLAENREVCEEILQTILEDKNLRVVDDNSDIAALMSCFTEKQVDNPKFPKLSSEVKRLKTTEGGASYAFDRV